MELIAGVTASKEYIDDIDRDITRAHFVPGVEIALARDLDLLAEYGVSLNDDSTDYVAFGIAYYIRTRSDR